MKRIFAGTAAALLAAVLFFPVSASAISAEKAVVMDAATGRVLYERRSEEESLIASTTKIMTALVVCRQCNVLDRMRIPAEAVGIEGSSLYLREGEVLTVQDLLYGLMLHSGNDAAVALAIYCGGTVEGFVERMNDMARELGLENTHFANPHGLDAPDHHSTARDLAILAAFAMEDPIFRQTVSTKTVTAGERSLRNHNKLLWQVAGADGVKTGYTRAAGRILVSSATREGRRIIAVTINAPDDWRDHAALLEEGFSRYALTRIIGAGERVEMMPVMGGEWAFVELVAGNAFSYPIEAGERVTLEPIGSGFVYAPVVEGADAGYAWVRINGTAVGKIPLRYGKTVERLPEEEVSFWEKLFGGDRK